MEAAATWIRESFAAATTSNAAAVVIALHGSVFDEEPKDREPFQPFLIALREEVERFTRPVLVTHGDAHVFTVDQPLELANLTASRFLVHPRSAGFASPSRRAAALRSCSRSASFRDGNTGRHGR